MTDGDAHRRTGTDAPTEALRAVAGDPARRPLLVALDFDGVLAPLVDDPDASRALPEAAEALRTLVAVPGVTLALVSGRSLADLHRRAEPPSGTVLVGSHGGERGSVGDDGLVHEPAPLTPEQQDLLARLRTGLAAAASGRDGAWVEDKPAAAVLHTRRAQPTDREAATAAAVAAAEGLGLAALRGKDVVEVQVVPVTKGDALLRLKDEVGAAAVVYAGDDTTDEHAFAVLGDGDVTVKVGDGPTGARYRVPDPPAVAGFLADLAADLAAALGGRAAP